MIDLRTTYLGLHLRTPLVSSASPFTYELDRIRGLELGWRDRIRRALGILHGNAG